MDYDTRLNNLYSNRSLLIFTNGVEWFIEQANRNFPRTQSWLPDMDPKTREYLDSPDFYRHAWESDNGYYKTEDLFPQE